MSETRSIPNEGPILVLGFHNSDIITEVDLTKISPTERIISEAGEFLIKKDTKIRINRGDFSYVFGMDFVDPRKPQLDDRGYYKLKAGKKYDLARPQEPIRQEKKTDIRTTNIVLPDRSKTWGGGGLNVALAIRALSPPEVTKIIYFDVENEKVVSRLYDNLVTASNDFEKNPCARQGLARAVANLGPENCLEVFLEDNSINYAYGTTAEDLTRINMVITRMTDGVSTIGDRIILIPKPRQSSDGGSGNFSSTLRDKLKENIEQATTVVVNTLQHKDIFQAVAELYVECTEKAGAAHNKKLIIAFTSNNIKWFAELYNDPVTTELANTFWRQAYCVFSEAEFAQYMETFKKGEIKDERDICLADGSPDFRKLREYIIAFCETRDPLSQNRLCITFGPHGSIGVDESHRILYAKTYLTRGITVYNTTACGDAWCGAFALLEHHMHQTAEGDVAGNRPASIKDVRLSRFMRFASGVALAKMTNPTGALRKDEVKNLLDNNYIPYTSVGVAATGAKLEFSDKIDEETGRVKRIIEADSIDYRIYSHIIGD